MTDPDARFVLAAQVSSGAILACPDYPTYRFGWLRDGAFCAAALDVAGERAASGRFHRWVAGIVLAHRGPMELAMAEVARGRRPAPDGGLPARFTADGLAPVGDGWGAFQLDGPGLWLWSLGRHAGVPLDEPLAAAAALTAGYLAAMYPTPSHDAWEEEPDAVASSTLGAAVAGLRAVAALGLDVDTTRSAEDAAHTAHTRLRARALARDDGALPRSDLDEAPDASLLWLGLIGALDADDPVWAATVARTAAALERPGGGVRRYPADTFYGGGEWPVLTAALAIARLRAAGHPGAPGPAAAEEKPTAALAWIAAQRDAAGRLPEQVADHALHPDQVAGWVARWGPVARPLSWSHAMTVLLRAALDDAQRPPDAQGQLDRVR